MAGAGLTGFLQNLSGGEMIVILIVALVVLGPERLPEMARGAGRMVHKLKTMTEGLQSEVRDVMDDPSMQPLRELGELATRPRQKLTEYALEAEAEERARRESELHAQHEAAVAEAEADAGAGAEDTGAEDAGSADGPVDDQAPTGSGDAGDTTEGDTAEGDTIRGEASDDAAADESGPATHDGGSPADAPTSAAPDPARLGPLVAAVEREAARARDAGRVHGQDST